MTAVLLRKANWHTRIQREGTRQRQVSAGQTERLQKKPTLQTPGFLTSVSRNENYIVVFTYLSTSVWSLTGILRLIQRVRK